MKNCRRLMAAVFLIGTVFAGAQTIQFPALQYDIIADTGAEGMIPNLKRELELRFGVYNDLFRFDPSLLTSPLRVRVFADGNAYDRYITERLGYTRPGAVYFHYSQADRRELVVNRSRDEDASMLSHQAFIQYLRAFIANPPSWMLEGFAIYFSTLRVLPPETVDYEENLLWLESAKTMGSDLPSSRAILMADASGGTGGIPADFQISSWAFVSFLLNGSVEYFRTLAESFMILSPQARAAENSLAVMKRFSTWNDIETMDKDFRSYLALRKTYRELMDDGHRYYAQGDIMNAELAFMNALDQRPSDYAPYYYLGLISYEEKDYDTAERYYRLSLERGADEALIYYALGINSAGAGRSGEARNHLQRASSLDPARFRERADDLLRRMESR